MEPLVGRDEELCTVEGFLEHGIPGALVLTGEAGIGKTTVWRRCVARARERGYCVLTAVAAGAEAQLAYVALGDLLEEVLEDALPGLPPPQRRALEVALLLADAEGAPPDPRAIGAAFLTLLRGLAASRRVLVAVDDVQWTDAPSARVLAFAARRLRDDPVGLLLTERIGESDDQTLRDLDRALADGATTRVPVGPLSLGALHHLLHSRLGMALARPVLRRVREASGGNPFYALEIAGALADGQGRPGDELPLPDNLHDLVRDRVSGLPPETRDALVAAAVLSEPTVPLVEAAVGVAGALDAAIDANVVEAANERIRFTHPLLASAACSRATSAERRAIHRRLSDLVVDAEERARHLALASIGPDRETARALDDAARRAVARGAPAAAAELLEQALALTPEGDTGWATRAVEAADAHLQAGDWDRARRLLRDVAEREPPGAARAAALARLALWVLEDVATTTRLAEQALAEAGDDAALRARIFTALCQSAHQRADWTVALRYAQDAVELAEQADDRTQLAVALTYLGIFEMITTEGEPLEHLERAAGLEERTGRLLPVYPTTWLGLRLLWLDQLDEARTYLDAQVRRAEEFGDEPNRSAVLLHLVELEWRAGNWELARRYGAEGYELAEQVGDVQGRGALLYARALIDAHLGELEDARRTAEEGLALAERLHDRVFTIQNLVVLGFIALSAGDHHEVVRRLGPLPELLERIGLRHPGVALFAADHIEALVALDELERAEALTAALEARGRDLGHARSRASARRCRALIVAARGDLEGALAALEDALAEHEALPVPFERARTLLVLGSTQRRAKRKRAARETLEQALAIFEELGARAWAEKARAELARIGGRAATSDRLTVTERRVAELVAQGRSNKEVAGELFVTVKSVEANLSKVYAKLGVRSRTELANQLIAAGKD